MTPNDIIEASAVCKMFYHVSRKNKLFVKKFHDSRKLYSDDRWIFSHYSDVFISFSNQLFVYLKEYVNEENFFLAKNVLMDKLYYSVLPLRVWNHLYLCERSQYMANMCRYCTKLYIKNKKISDHINNKLFVEINQFPIWLSPGVVVPRRITLFVHTNIAAINDPFGLNFGLLYYESINSPFFLWKAYLDILCRIVFNVSQRFVLSLIVTSIDANCREFAVCTSKNCLNLKISKVRAIFFRGLVVFCKKLSEVSCDNFDPNFIIDVFKKYKKVENYFSEYLGLERNDNFCIHLRLSLSQRFNIDVDVYISKKKKLVHMSLVKPLFFY